MPAEANEEPILPFGDLPQPTPPQIPASRPRKRKPSQVKQLIDGCDWEAYETSVIEVVQQAIKKYCQLHDAFMAEKVFQISLWTDPQRQTTAVNFETKEHATAHNMKWARIFREKYNDEETAIRLEKEGYNGSPADFEHSEFLKYKHQELEKLDQLEYQYQTHSHAADARISASLRKVVRQIRERDMLAGLPREEEVWIGVNSPRDWYDYVTKI